jgi:hypothetical protein
LYTSGLKSSGQIVIELLQQLLLLCDDICIGRRWW